MRHDEIRQKMIRHQTTLTKQNSIEERHECERSTKDSPRIRGIGIDGTRAVTDNEGNLEKDTHTRACFIVRAEILSVPRKIGSVREET